MTSPASCPLYLLAAAALRRESLRYEPYGGVPEIISHRSDSFSPPFRAGLTCIGIVGPRRRRPAHGHGTVFRAPSCMGFETRSRRERIVSNGQTTCKPEETIGPAHSGARTMWTLWRSGHDQYLSPEYMQSVPIAYGVRQTTAGVRGVSPEYGVMRSETAEYGRFLNHEDVENHRRVAFLGYEVARRLFSNIPPVGETIRIGGVSFEVIALCRTGRSNYFIG